MAHYIAVNHPRQLIALFSPKCGSSVIKQWFNHTLDIKDPNIHRNIHHYLIWPWKLRAYPHYRKVFFVRNPFRRLVSFFADWVVRNNTLWCFADDRKQFRLHDKSFREFVHILDHLWRRNLEFQHHLKPQTRGLTELSFDYVVRLETFDTDIQRLNACLGIHYVPPRLNTTSYNRLVKSAADTLKPSALRDAGMPTYDCFYTAELVDIVCRIYNRDVTFYYQQMLVATDHGAVANPGQRPSGWSRPEVTTVEVVHDAVPSDKRGALPA